MKIFGIPVKIEFSFWLIAAFLGSRRLSEPELLVEWLVVVFVSILLHEFGHALVGRAFGLTPEIRLHSFGGLTSWGEEKAISPKQNIAISLAGPGAGLLFGGLVFLIGRSFSELPESRLWDVTYFDLLWVNWGWSVFNLLPILPLDGGHVMRSLEEWWIRRTGGLISHTVSLIFAGGIAAWAISLGSLWIGLLGVWFAFANGSALYQLWQQYRDRSQPTSLDQAQETLNNQEGDAAAHQADKV
jgi:Zn-dependent protease